MDELRVELTDLSGVGFDLDLIGFSGDELAGLGVAGSGQDALTDPDAIPEPPDEPVSARGDLWTMGDHRLLCGDATDERDVGRALDGAEPHLMVTDPPYGVGYDPDWRNRSGLGWSQSRSVGQVAADDQGDWSQAWGLFSGDVIYCWAPPGPNQFDFYRALEESGFPIRMQIIWGKQHFPIGRGNYHVQHEPCLYAVRKNKKAHWQGSRKESTLWQIANRSAFHGEEDDMRTVHSTQKPVECMRRPIVNNSKRGDHVYDPFLGSGTTLIAAEMEGRVCHGLEIEPTYCDVIVRRWQEYIGRDATLDGDGRTFTEITKERDGTPRPKTEADTSKARDRQSGKAKHQARRRAAKSRAADGAAASQ